MDVDLVLHYERIILKKGVTMKRRQILKIFIILGMLAAMISSVFNLSMNVKAEAASTNKTNVKLIKGQSCQLKINDINVSVKWSSSNRKVASVSSKGKVTVKKKGSAVITGTAGGKKYLYKVNGYSFLSKKQAETAVTHYCEKQQSSFYYNEAVKNGGQYVIWIHYTQTGMLAKFVVESKTGKVVSYAPYIGVDEPAVDNPKAEDRFNALDYL